MLDSDPRRLWDETVLEAGNCIKVLTDSEVLAVFLGLYSMYKFRGKGQDNSSFLAFLSAMKQSNRFSEEKLVEGLAKFEDNTEGQGPTESISLKDFSERPKGGKKVGLIHGHYRRLTLAHMTGFVLARRHCDELIVLIESGERTENFKGVRRVLSEDRRVLMMIATGLADYVGVVKRGDYTDETYRGLVRVFRPDVYFGVNDFPLEMREEWKLRAESVGAELIFLPKMGRISTTLMEEGD